MTKIRSSLLPSTITALTWKQNNRRYSTKNPNKNEWEGRDSQETGLRDNRHILKVIHLLGELTKEKGPNNSEHGRSH